MKIAFVTRSLAGGGAERVVSVLANELSRFEIVEEVNIIAIIEDKVTYPVLPSINYYPNENIYTGKVKRILQRMLFLKGKLKEINADIVISFCTQINIYAIFAMLGLKGKLVISERNDPNSDPIQRWVRNFRNIVYRKCKYAVFQTPDAQKYFKKIITGPTKVIMNPIKANLPKRNQNEREPRIVSVARLTDVKNHAMLIKAFSNFSKTHKDYVLEIYGEGPEESSLRALINELDLVDSVHLKGFCSNVHDEISNAACFALVSNYEGISNSMIEAMGIGLPVICTDCPIGGARMVIDSMKNGILISVGDQNALESALAKIADDNEFAMALGRNALKVNERLSAEGIAKEWLEYMKVVLFNGENE